MWHLLPAGKHERVRVSDERLARRKFDHSDHVSNWRPLSRVVLLAVAVGGVAAVALVPGEAASKTALGLGAVAIAIAAGNYAESPDWDEVEKDVADP